LLWALRGGGGNFGVLTELRFALRPLGRTVPGRKRFYPIERGAEVLSGFRDVMMAAPKELCGGLAPALTRSRVVRRANKARSRDGESCHRGY
jgi:hypothetical protein